MIYFLGIVEEESIEEFFLILKVITFILFILFIILPIYYTICWWRIFSKSNEKGWKSLIPGYSLITQLSIAGTSFMIAIPLIVFICSIFVIKLPYLGDSILIILKLIRNPITIIIWDIYLLIFWIIKNLKLADIFDKGIGFAIGLIILNPIFIGILAFNKKCVNAAYNYKETDYQQKNYVSNGVVWSDSMAKVKGNNYNQINQNKKCIKCGSEENINSNFCTKCGNKLYDLK